MILSKVDVAHLPTRIEPLLRLSAFLGGPEILCKRDDQTGLGFGGNKTRKLEFLLAQAQESGARTLITTGAIQSNHCRQTAALAARMGFDCVLILAGNPPEKVTGNLFLDHLFQAEIIWTTREERDAKLHAVFDQLRNEGRKPFLIPYGASNPVGLMGYVEAMRELKKQDSMVDWIVVASSSGGTQAGMVLGAELTSFTGNVLGISIDCAEVELKRIVTDLIKGGVDLLGEIINISSEKVIVNDHYLGGGYAVMGEPEIEAIRLFASLEGLTLDPVYTGRAAAGMIDLVREGFFRKEERILFWHTGGTPVLFAEPYLSQLQ